MNEVFRFIALRHPKPKRFPTVKLFINTALLGSLETALSSSTPRETLETHANDYIASDDYFGRDATLRQPLSEFYDALTESDELTITELSDQVMTTFGLTTADLLDNTDFQADHTQLSDSYLAAMISEDVTEEHRAQLLKYLLIIDLLIKVNDERDGAETISMESHFSGNIQLPENIFPLPEAQVITSPNTYLADLAEKKRDLELRKDNLMLADRELGAINHADFIAAQETLWTAEAEELKTLAAEVTANRDENYVEFIRHQTELNKSKKDCCEDDHKTCCCSSNDSKSERITEDDPRDPVYDSLPPVNLESSISVAFALTAEQLTNFSESTQAILEEKSQGNSITLMEAQEYIEEELIYTGNQLSDLELQQNRNIHLRYGKTVISVNAQILNL